MDVLELGSRYDVVILTAGVSHTGRGLRGPGAGSEALAVAIHRDVLSVLSASISNPVPWRRRGACVHGRTVLCAALLSASAPTRCQSPSKASGSSRGAVRSCRVDFYFNYLPFSAMILLGFNFIAPRAIARGLSPCPWQPNWEEDCILLTPSCTSSSGFC